MSPDVVRYDAHADQGTSVRGADGPELANSRRGAWHRWAPAFLILGAIAIVVLAVTLPIELLTKHEPGDVGVKAGTAILPAVHPSTPLAGLPAAPQPRPAPTPIAVPDGSKEAAARWLSGPGGQALRAVTSDLGAASQAGGIGSYFYYSMMRTCRQLVSDTERAETAPPIPIPALQLLYSQTLTGIAQSAQRCSSAIRAKPVGDEGIVTNENMTLLKQAMSGFAHESKDLYTSTYGLVHLSRT